MNKTIYKSIIYTFVSQIIGILSSICMSVFIPKITSVLNFSYWQLFVFYSSFIGLLHLGWIDGIYLKYGGKNLYQVDSKSFSSQFILYTVFHFFVAAILFCYVSLLNSHEKEVLYFVILYIPIKNIYSYFSMTLLSTDNIVQNSKCDMLRKGFLIISILFLLFCQINTGYKIIVILFIISELLPFFLMQKSFNEILNIRKLLPFNIAIKEVINNIHWGWSLTVSNIVSTLILGISRFFIKNEWDIITFGKVSLALSMSLFMIMIITQLSFTLFPYIRKADEDKRKRVFSTLNGILSIMFYMTFILYFPIAYIVKLWLPQYTDSIFYMSILCGICLFEGKMSVLCTTYLKCLNEQRLLLKINLLTVVVSLILSYFSSVVFHNLTLVLYSMIIAVAFRCLISILFIQNRMHMKPDCNILLQDLTMVIIFLLIQYLLHYWLSFVSMLVVLVGLFTFRRHDIVSYIYILKK